MSWKCKGCGEPESKGTLNNIGECFNCYMKGQSNHE